jgi:ABC-type Na+ efflux pump permease subunit
VIHVSAWPTVVSLLIVACALSTLTILKMRVWNPSREFHQSAAEAVPAVSSEDTTPAPPRVHRAVWNQPVIWREMRTRAYGRRMVWIKLSYIAMVLIIATVSALANRGQSQNELVLGMVSGPAFAFLGIAILSLLLTNAQAVTSLTNERDGRTLEILLVTDLRPHEFILGKIGGSLWNAKEMILLPLLLVIIMAAMGQTASLTAENVVYLCVTYLVLSIFAVALGLHQGLTYENSRHAIGHSLGTMFFLCVGIFIFMLLLVEARSSFAIQLQSFILFIGFGSLGLYSSLTFRNPSNALTLASLVLPFLTFYAITDFLLGGNLGVCLWICVAYGFAAVAMMVPAMNDFDIALGRNAQDAG